MKKIIVGSLLAAAALTLPSCSTSPEDQFYEDVKALSAEYGGPGPSSKAEALEGGHKVCDMLTAVRVDDLPIFMLAAFIEEEPDMPAAAIGELSKLAAEDLCPVNLEVASVLNTYLQEG